MIKTTSVPDITTIEKEKTPIAEKKIIPIRKDQLNNQNVNPIATAKKQTVINTVAKNSKQAILNKHAKVSVSAGEVAEEDQWNSTALLSPHEPVKLDAASLELIALEKPEAENQ